MVRIDSDDGSDTFSWTSDDELEDKKPIIVITSTREEGSSSSGPSSELFQYFVKAGFSEDLVSKAIHENGDEDMDSILNALLTYVHLESSPSDEQGVSNHPETQQNEDIVATVDDSDQKLDVDSDWSSDYNEALLDEFSDSDFCPGLEMRSVMRYKPSILVISSRMVVQVRMFNKCTKGKAAIKSRLATGQSQKYYPEDMMYYSLPSTKTSCYESYY